MDTKQAIGAINWSLYEKNVLLTLQDAIERFVELYASTEKVSQISIWTDPQACLTAISFETSSHAREHNSRQAQYFRERGLEDYARDAEALTLQGNPADFKYAEFHSINHPELHPLTSVNFSDTQLENEVLSIIYKSLLRVVDQAATNSVLNKLPREKDLWIGVNSPDDWYDGLRKV